MAGGVRVLAKTSFFANKVRRGSNRLQCTSSNRRDNKKDTKCVLASACLLAWLCVCV